MLFPLPEKSSAGILSNYAVFPIFKSFNAACTSSRGIGYLVLLVAGCLKKNKCKKGYKFVHQVLTRSKQVRTTIIQDKS